MAEAGRLQLPEVFKRFLGDLESTLAGPAPGGRFARLMLGVAVSWWIYVPVHELLHAVGCLLGGGTVERLEIAPLYGGALLAKAIPFVVSGGDYAGRLSGFDTGGNDAIYALTVALPYVLAPLGYLLLGLAVRRGSAFLFGAATPLLFSPLISVTGDFLELGGLLLFQVWPAAGCAYRGFVSDDLFHLVGQIRALRGTPHWNLGVPLFAATSQALGAVLAWTAFRCSAWFQGSDQGSGSGHESA